MGMLHKALGYLQELNQLPEGSGLPDTPEEAKNVAGQFQTPDNMGFYRDYIQQAADKRQKDLIGNRWLALAQGAAHLIPGDRGGWARAAQAGLGGLQAASSLDARAKDAEMANRLRLAGYEQTRDAGQMGLAKDLYTSGVNAKHNDARSNLSAAINLAQAEDASKRGWSQVNWQQRPQEQLRYDAAINLGMTPEEAERYALTGSRSGMDTSMQTILNTYSKALTAANATKAAGYAVTPEDQAVLDALREKVNGYLKSGDISPADVGTAAMHSESAVPSVGDMAAQVAPKNLKVEESGKLNQIYAVGDKAIAASDGNYEKAKKLLAGTQGLSPGEKIYMLRAIEAANNRRQLAAANANARR